MLLFIEGVSSILYRAGFFCFFYSLFSLDFCYICFCLLYVWAVFVNTWQKGGDLDKYVGILFVLFRGRYYDVFICVSCFTLLIDLYLWVIHDICLYFVLCEIRNLFFVYLYFPHMHLCVCWVFQEICKLTQSCCCLHLQLMDSS